MAIKKAPRLFINLSGPNGNAFVLLAYARYLAKQLGLDGRQITCAMKAGTYDELLEVFKLHFGHVVTLYR